MERNGHSLTRNMDRADRVLIYGCAFNQSTEETAFADLNRLVGEGRNIVLVGCLPNINPRGLKKYKLPIIPHRQYEKLDKIFKTSVPWGEVGQENIRYDRLRDGPWFNAADRLWRLVTGAPLRRYDIQVEWGCLSECTFCVDKLTVGNTVSKPLDKCVAEFEEALRQGYRDIKLLGDDVGTWGQDIGSDVVELLDAITRIEGRCSLTVKEINVLWMVEFLDRLTPILERGRFSTLHMGFQSGSNRILKLMKRDYTCADIARVMERLEPVLPLTGAVIIGFPTETEEDFQASLEMLDRFHLMMGDLFLYQDRPGSVAAELEPKVPEEVKWARMDEAARVLGRKYNIRREPDKYYFDRGFISRVRFKLNQKLGRPGKPLVKAPAHPGKRLVRAPA